MKVVMFMLKSCPYCIKADRFIEELCEENPQYRQIEIARIDEKATKYDYFYVPSFYINEVKIHEGAATKEDVKMVLDKALEG